MKTNLDRSLRRESYVDCGRQDDRSASWVGRVSSTGCGRTRSSRYSHAPGDIRAMGARYAMRGRGATSPSSAGPRRWFRPYRRALERAFGPRVFETYGSRETMLIAAECAAHDGMHVAEENLLVEIVGDDGRPVGPGETGAVAVTDLHNVGMPLIRYANGDMATWGPKETWSMWTHLAPHRACRRASKRHDARCPRSPRAGDALHLALERARGRDQGVPGRAEELG